jgi:hypothetical protein
VPPLIQRWRENNYTWGGPRAWACFRPDADVLVPMYYESGAGDIVSPFHGEERSISLLMRFGYEVGDGKNLVEHYGHRLRYELIEYWKAHPLPGSQQGLKSGAVGGCNPLGHLGMHASRACMLKAAGAAPNPPVCC